MATRETLETALLSSWDRDTLAVYADHLQAEGDPRGELIALDLQIAATGNTAELSKRRTSLLFAWLGALVPVDDVHASWIGDSLQFGFVDHLHFSGRGNAVARLEQALASAAGPYIRALSLTGAGPELEEALAVIAKSEHRWLTRLTLDGFAHAPLAPEIVAAALRAMPNLASLDLRRPLQLAAFSHPTIRHLKVAWRETYVGLGDGASFDAVEELEIERHDAYTANWDDDLDPAPAPASKLPEIAFPALRRLALDGTFHEALDFLRGFSARARVRVLRIPDLPSAADRDDLAGAIHDMEALETLEITRGSYYQPQPIPRVAIVGGAAWPWPMQEAATGQGLRVFMPSAKYGDIVAVLDAVLALEEHYERLPVAARSAWDQLWRALPATGTVTFPAGALASAVEAIPSLMEHGWRELREELSSRRPLAADAMVRIERCLVD